MSDSSSIEWTDATWNPVRGCSRVSEGCRNCYAERMAVRMSGPGQWGEGFAVAPRHHGENGRPTTGVRGKWTGKVELIPSMLDRPLRWRKPRKVFVNSMSDLFHESLPDEAIDRVFAVMALARRHTFQVLTKRPERMERYLSAHDRDRAWCDAGARLDIPLTHPMTKHPGATSPDNALWLNVDSATDSGDRPLPNVWLGVSVEDQATADERIPLLLQTPAAVRFVSYEPALGPVDFTGWLYSCDGDCNQPTHPIEPTLDWVIVGGESGPGARPFDVAWARSTVEQCKAAGVAVFVKQLGANIRASGDSINGWPINTAPGLWSDTRVDPPRIHVTSKKGGDPAEWSPDLRVREFPR
jgi:protein gp37